MVLETRAVLDSTTVEVTTNGAKNADMKIVTLRHTWLPIVRAPFHGNAIGIQMVWVY